MRKYVSFHIPFAILCVALQTAPSVTTVTCLAAVHKLQVGVSDKYAFAGNAVTKVTVSNPSSNPPIVDAGPDQSITLPTSSVNLTGSGIPGTGHTISSYAWTEFSGPSTFTIFSPSFASTSVTGLVAGTYLFQLTVTDDVSVSATDEVQIIVNDAPLTHGVIIEKTGPGAVLQLNSMDTVGTSIVLHLINGFIKVDQTALNRSVFIHTTSSGNVSDNKTALSYLGMNSNDILIVTHNYVPNYIGSVGVSWNGTAWTIMREDGLPMPEGERFNVLVIKQ